MSDTTSCGYTKRGTEWQSLLIDANKKDECAYDYKYERKRTDALEWLGNSFYWDETPEGNDFWAYVYDRLCHISDLGRK